MALQVVIIYGAKPRQHGGAHAHSLHHFGIAPACFEQCMTCRGEPRSGFGWGPRHSLCGYSKND